MSDVAAFSSETNWWPLVDEEGEIAAAGDRDH